MADEQCRLCDDDTTGDAIPPNGAASDGGTMADAGPLPTSATTPPAADLRRRPGDYTIEQLDRLLESLLQKH